MGTSLTGLEIKDTYDGLVKTTDNAPLTGSLKVLTDGLGNDSALALSTLGASVAGSLALRSAALATAATQILVVNGDPSSTTRDILTRTPAQIRSDIGAGTGDGTVTGTGTLNFVSKFSSASAIGNSSIFDDGNVGIGTITPVGILHLKKAAAATRLAIDGDAGQSKLISYRTAGVQRFGLYVNNAAEAGANAGSNFAVRAYADAGTLLTTPLFIQRSTGNVGIGNNLTPTSTLDVTGTLAVSGNATFDTDTLFVDAANNRVGVGSITPSHVLDIQSTAATFRIRNTTPTPAGGTSSLLFEGINNFSGTSQSFINSIQAGSSGATQLAFGTGATVDAIATERMRITSAGLVGIGTSAPAVKLQINDASFPELRITDGTISYQMFASTGSGEFVQGTITNQPITFRTNSVERLRVTNNGLTFNGDTAAANALDDYEEGTWTPLLIGSTSGQATSGGNTYGNYTKIGRLVTLNFVISVSSVNTLLGVVYLSQLPFNLAAGAALENRYPTGPISFYGLGSSWCGVLISSDGNTNKLILSGVKATASTGQTNLTDADLTSSTVITGSIQYIA